jgi:hypothetical protein
MKNETKAVFVLLALVLATMCAMPPWVVTVESSSVQRTGLRLEAMQLGYHWIWTPPEAPSRWDGIFDEHPYRVVYKATTTPAINSGVLVLQLVISAIIGGLALLVPWVRGGVAIKSANG